MITSLAYGLMIKHYPFWWDIWIVNICYDNHGPPLCSFCPHDLCNLQAVVSLIHIFMIIFIQRFVRFQLVCWHDQCAPGWTCSCYWCCHLVNTECQTGAHTQNALFVLVPKWCNRSSIILIWPKSPFDAWTSTNHIFFCVSLNLLHDIFVHVTLWFSVL